jgi:ornithine cyclodeaminase/alanine dehydrogenase-like protein (mu-crystallin family)
VIGAGAHGRAHLRFLCGLYAFDAPVRTVARPEGAARGADIIVTATTARAPVLHGAWLAPGAHVCGVGSATPSHRELDSEVLERASVVAVDTREAALEEAGDLIVPIDEGRLSPGKVAEVGEILLGQRPGRGGAEDITVYKGVGTAALDAAVAAAIHRRAVELGIGTEIPFTAEELRG